MTARDLRTALACGRPGCRCAKARFRVAHCPAHRDRMPSLGLDDRSGRLLFRCRAGCSQSEVLAALRARGLWGEPRSVYTRPCSPEEEGRRDVLWEERHKRERLAPYLPVYAEADELREFDRAVRDARDLATALGPDHPDTWSLLALAAELERLTPLA